MSRFLVDTHVLLWWLADDPQLSPTARAAISDPRAEALVSAASAWEIAIKRSLGKLTAPDDLLEITAEEGFAYSPSPHGTRGERVRCRSTTGIPSTACSPPRRSSRGFRW